MEFISLSDVLCKVAECIDLPPRFCCDNSHIGNISSNAANAFWNAANKNHPGMLGDSIGEKIEWARKMSIAALYLNNAVLESPDAPLQWAEFDGNRRVNVSSDLIKKEALEIFEHAIGWGNRLDEKYNNHFRNAINQGDEALMLPVSVSQDEGLTRDGERIRLMQIGCDNAKLIAFLNANDVAHSLEIQKAPASEPVAPAAALTLPPAEGITKQQVLIAFEALVKPFNLKKALGDGKGLYGETAPGSARTQKGTPGAKHAALWNPVILAVGLRDKHSVSMLHLKNAFKDHTFLRRWADEWRSALDSLGE